MLRAYWKCFLYIINHKLNVLIECWKEGLYIQGIFHDMSKFSPKEFHHYANGTLITTKRGILLRLIKRLTDSDILGGSPVLISSISRFGSRGVLIDDNLNVAMMYISQLNLYKLPGGGIEEGESKEEAFLREIREETGFEAEILHDLGYIEEHKNNNNFLQYSYCFG